MLTKVLDRLLILVSLYFVYMLIFHLPSRCYHNNNNNNNNINNINNNNNNIPPLITPTPTPPPQPAPCPYSKVENDDPEFYNTHDELLCRNNEDANELMKRFLKIQNENLDTIKEGGKFIIYSATDLAGLGNRIPALVASFMLALVLDRGFLVHWPEVSERNTMDNDEDSMVMPMFSDLFVPPVAIDMMAIPAYNLIFDYDKTATLRLDESADLLMCGDLEEEMADYNFVVVKGWRPFFDLLFHNTYVVAKIERLQLVSLVHDLAACILRPVPRVHELVRQFKMQNYITKRHKLIGVHIRKQSSHGLTKREQEGLWSCVRKKYPPPYNYELGDWSSYNYGDEVVVNPPENSQKFANVTYLYFLASDSNATIAMVPPDILPYVVRVGGNISRSTNEGVIRALADIWILGHSHELYGAQGTTFLSAVRTIFSSKTSLATLGNNKVDKFCRTVGMLPCYKWWDIFKSQHSANFSVSCFQGSASSKHIVVC